MRIVIRENLIDIVKSLRLGKVIIYPTETTYGIGCDAYNQKAVDAIYNIKNRPKDKPVLALVGTVAEAKRYLVWNSMLEDIANKYWPGPLTVRAHSTDEGKKMAKGVIMPNGVIAIRVTTNKAASFLATLLGRPLVSTSANIYGDKEIYDSKILIDLFAEREHQPDILLDYGVLPFHPPSTIVDVTGDSLKIIRQGEVKM